MSGERYTDTEYYSESAYTADISTKMRVPDRLMAHNGHQDEDERWKEKDSIFNMKVPDRILVAGSDQHISSKSTPRELQLENSVIPPTPEHVRVQTPPRSIKLEEVPFPSASDAPEPQSPPRANYPNHQQNNKYISKKDRTITFDPDLSIGNESNLSIYDEVQRMRTQMAKLNHRLMAMELENQQHNQRWQMLSVLVSAYFLVKTMAWINRS